MKPRNVITRSGRRVRGLFASRKAGRMIPWESTLERDALLLFEFSPGVISYSEHQCKVEYFNDTKISAYYPDFKLYLRNEAELFIEIKPERRIQKKDEAERFEAISNHFELCNQPFKVITDVEIHKQPRLNNLRRLAYHRVRSFEQIDLSLEPKAKDINGFTFSKLSELVGGEVHVMRLLASGVLSFDINNQLTADSLIHCSEGSDHDALYF